MNPFQKRLLWSSSLLTGLTGIVYFWMKHFLEPADPWAVINHPLQPWVLKAHIIVAPVMIFAVGLIATEHIWRHFRSSMRLSRRSGLMTMWLLAPMILTGYLIQAVTHRGWLAVIVWTHIVTGVLYLAGLGIHQWVLWRRRRVRARLGGGRWEAVGRLGVEEPEAEEVLEAEGVSGGTGRGGV